MRFEVTHSWVFKLSASSRIVSSRSFSDFFVEVDNFKDLLLQFFHQRRWEDPQYGQLDVSGPDHKKLFTMYVKRKLTSLDHIRTKVRDDRQSSI